MLKMCISHTAVHNIIICYSLVMFNCKGKVITTKMGVFCDLYFFETQSLSWKVVRNGEKSFETPFRLRKIEWDVWLLESAASLRHFARHLGVSQSVVARTWNHFQTQGNVAYKPGADRHEHRRSFCCAFSVKPPLNEYRKCPE